MESRKSFTRTLLSMFTLLLVLGFAASAHASSRLYTGQLIIQSFGNETTTGSAYPFSTTVNLGIPLIGQCNTNPTHFQETLTFPSTPYSGLLAVFTIPTYGGAVATIDTNSDTVPDLVQGCTYTSVGDPLTGSGYVNTTGLQSVQQTQYDPRKFTLSQSDLNKSGSGASFAPYGVYLWEIHFADLHNAGGAFEEDGGAGSFSVVHPGERKAVQTEGKNKFGGVMSLLGSYGDSEGYFYANLTTSVYYFNWLFDKLGGGGAAYSGTELTAGFVHQYKNYGNTRASGSYRTNTVYAEVFPWSTGTVAVTALEGSFPTVLQRTGTDHRNKNGTGVVQLVSPMLTHWIGEANSSTAAIGIMTITFVPEPSSLMVLGAGASMMGLLFIGRRKF